MLFYFGLGGLVGPGTKINLWVVCAMLAPLAFEQALILAGAKAKVSIGPDGCTQQDASEHRRAIDATHAFMQGAIIPFVIVYAVLRFVLKFRITALDSLALTVALTTGIVALLWSLPRYRARAFRRVQALRPSTSLSWRDVDRVSIRPGASGTFRLRVKGRSWIHAHPPPGTVSFEFEATPEQAAALESAIRQWRGPSPR
jgi:hypothetical protein